MPTLSPDRLRARRIARGLTREQLGNAVTRTWQTVAYWETGDRTPHYRVVIALARVLHCKVADLCEPE